MLEDAASRDRTTARRVELLKILLHERYLTREQLINRVEGKLGKSCFGDAAWIDTFYRDMRAVGHALHAAGYHLTYSRSLAKPGYYLSEQPAISEDLAKILASSVNEVDPRQIDIYKKLSFRQRFLKGCSISKLACQVAANRLRQQNPRLGMDEAQRIIIEKSYSLDWRAR